MIRYYDAMKLFVDRFSEAFSCAKPFWRIRVFPVSNVGRGGDKRGLGGVIYCGAFIHSINIHSILRNGENGSELSLRCVSIDSIRSSVSRSQGLSVSLQPYDTDLLLSYISPY